MVFYNHNTYGLDENREWDYESLHVPEYEEAVKNSWIYKELHAVRNVRPSFHNPLGFYGGLAYTGFFTCFMQGFVPFGCVNFPYI